MKIPDELNEEWLREELIKYEAHRRAEYVFNPKQFEFAEQAVDNYLNPPPKTEYSEEIITNLAKIYGSDTRTMVCVAQICDEVLDRSGELLGKVRDEHRKQRPPMLY